MISSPTYATPRRIAAALLICAAVGIAGCGRGTAQNAANEYLNALQIHNYEKCYDLLTHQDQVDRPIEQFLAEIPMAPDVSKDWFKPVLAAYKFGLGGSRMENGKAVVTVNVTRPDLPLFERTIDAKLTFDTNPNDTPEQLGAEWLAKGNFPKLTYGDNMVFVKEDGKWRLLADFPVIEKIVKEHADAVNLYHQAEYDQAISAYQTLLAELSMQDTTGIEGLAYLYNRELIDIRRVKSEVPDALAYVNAKKIVLSDAAEKMSETRHPGIFGKITNNGDRPIDQVTVTVNYYIDKGSHRKLVYSETHVPIMTPLEFTDFSAKVLPFVPGETRGFGFDLTAPVETQQKATTDLNVTGIVFTQSTAPLPKPPAAT
ncbi:MAG: hypothetical protein ACREQI_05390, partial [Candidatus Binataceae bacterium]